MADNDKKPYAHLVPAILTGTAALLAALTTVYVNVRGDKPATPVPVIAVATVPVPSDKPAAGDATQAPPAAQARRLQLDRIAVQKDGSVGTTDWRFAVEANGEPLLVFQQDGLDDTGGRNVATPKDVAALVRTPSAQASRIVVKGWRGSRLRVSPGVPDVTGEGLLTAAGLVAPLTVQAVAADGPAFVFYFSASPD